MAYKADENGNFAQYMFGDDMMVSPVVVPIDKTTQLANVRTLKGGYVPLLVFVPRADLLQLDHVTIPHTPFTKFFPR